MLEYVNVVHVYRRQKSRNVGRNKIFLFLAQWPKSLSFLQRISTYYYVRLRNVSTGRGGKFCKTSLMSQIPRCVGRRNFIDVWNLVFSKQADRE